MSNHIKKGIQKSPDAFVPSGLFFPDASDAVTKALVGFLVDGIQAVEDYAKFVSIAGV